MTFQKIYKVNDVDGKTRLMTRKGLDHAQENYVLYFARKCVYGHNGDSPVIGVGSDYLKHSEVEGPYAVPVKEKSSFVDGDEVRIEPIRLVLPKIPSFVPVELLTLIFEDENFSFNLLAYKKRAHEVADYAVEEFNRRVSNVQRSERTLVGEYSDARVWLWHQCSGKYLSVSLAIFGTPRINIDFAIHDLLPAEVFNNKVYQISREHLKKGLAYNLDLSAIKDVRQVSKLENIIL